MQRVAPAPCYIAFIIIDGEVSREIRKLISDETATTSVNSLQLLLRRTSNVCHSILDLTLHRFDLSRRALRRGKLFAKLVDVFVRLGYAV